MTYDAIDPDDDGVVEADTDNESTTTESLDIGPVKYLDRIEEIDEQAASVDISFPNQVTGNLFYAIRATRLEHIIESGPMELTADGVSDGSYGYLLADGTYTESGADSVVLHDGRENNRASGMLIITGAGGTNHTGVRNQSWAPNRPRSNWNQYLLNGVIADGGYDEITISNAASGGEVIVNATIYQGEWTE